MIIVPEMVASVVGVYNGLGFTQVEIKVRMMIGRVIELVTMSTCLLIFHETSHALPPSFALPVSVSLSIWLLSCSCACGVPACVMLFHMSCVARYDWSLFG